MASEISHRHSATGETLYATIRNVSRQMWSTAGTPNFETLTVANWANYAITMTETPASSYFFVGTFPAVSGNMISGWYWVDVFKRAGGAAAISDTLLASYFGYWDGTAFKWWADDAISANVTAVDGQPVELETTGTDTAGVTELLTRIPDATPGAAGGLPVLDGSGNLVVYSVSQAVTLPSTIPASWIGTGTGQISIANGVVAASGNWSTLDAAGVRTAVGLASANLDTQLADLPTVAEFEARTIVSANYATSANQTSILGYVDCLPAVWVTPLDAAGTRSAVGLASANLDTQLADIPTVAEFEARTIVAANYATVANQTTILGYVDCLPASWVIPLDAAGTRSALGLSSANLDAQLNAISGYVDVLPATWVTPLDATATQSAAAAALVAYDPPTKAEMDALLTAQLSESYAAVHTVPSLTQILFEIRSHMAEKAISGTMLTTLRIDGTTTATTSTLDSDTAPTSITRTT